MSEEMTVDQAEDLLRRTRVTRVDAVELPSGVVWSSYVVFDDMVPFCAALESPGSSLNYTPQPGQWDTVPMAKVRDLVDRLETAARTTTYASSEALDTLLCYAEPGDTLYTALQAYTAEMGVLQ